MSKRHRSPTGDDSQLDTNGHEQFHTETIFDIELLGLLALVVVKDTSIGQHAVDIEKQ